MGIPPIDSEALQARMNEIALTMKIAVPVERINDLLCCAFEGGSNYWIRCSAVVNDDRRGVTYNHEIPLAGGTVALCDYDYMDDEPNVDEWHQLDRAAIERGMPIFQKIAGGQHLADFLNENEDAITGDVFLQCCVFGEVVYG
jgi:hypothetical protein